MVILANKVPTPNTKHALVDEKSTRRKTLDIHPISSGKENLWIEMGYGMPAGCWCINEEISRVHLDVSMLELPMFNIMGTHYYH